MLSQLGNDVSSLLFRYKVCRCLKLAIEPGSDVNWLLLMSTFDTRVIFPIKVGSDVRRL